MAFSFLLSFFIGHTHNVPSDRQKETCRTSTVEEGKKATRVTSKQRGEGEEGEDGIEGHGTEAEIDDGRPEF